jgi:uncharacterized membrane protein
MSDLIAVAYDDRETAERVRDELARLIPRISGYGGRVIQSSLSTEAEEKLQEALSATAAPA